MDTFTTPLSDLITRCVQQPSPANDERAFAELLRAEVGVVAKGELPNVPPGAHMVISAAQIEGLGKTALPDGRVMILACADFPAFRARYGGSFNATITGRDLLETALFNQDCQGVRINSAASEHSLVLTRDQIHALLHGPSKPWWRRLF